MPFALVHSNQERRFYSIPSRCPVLSCNLLKTYSKNYSLYQSLTRQSIYRTILSPQAGAIWMYRWLKRESGGNPELTRSGKRERVFKDTAHSIAREVEC